MGRNREEWCSEALEWNGLLRTVFHSSERTRKLKRKKVSHQSFPRALLIQRADGVQRVFYSA